MSGPSTSTSSGQEDLSRSTGVNITGGIRPEHQTDKTGVTSMHSNDPHFSDQRLTSSNESAVADRGQARAPMGGFGTVEPSVGADFSSGHTQSQKEQGGDRPLEEPSGHQVDAVRGEKETAERQQAGGQASEGTGELWVKSTGMAADGGDFDAAKPGAGREADRTFSEGSFVCSMLILFHRSFGTERRPPRPLIHFCLLGSTDQQSVGREKKERMYLG